MPDIYASITAADVATLERLAGALELRAADLLRRGILNEFVSQITFPKKAKVLEIGCGTGGVTRFLAGLPDVSHAVGIDPSPLFIAKAKELAGSVQTLTFQEGDGRALPWEDRSFDAVLFHTCLRNKSASRKRTQSPMPIRWRHAAAFPRSCSMRMTKTRSYRDCAVNSVIRNLSSFVGLLIRRRAESQPPVTPIIHDPPLPPPRRVQNNAGVPREVYESEIRRYQAFLDSEFNSDDLPIVRPRKGW